MATGILTRAALDRRREGGRARPRRRSGPGPSRRNTGRALTLVDDSDLWGASQGLRHRLRRPEVQGARVRRQEGGLSRRWKRRHSLPPDRHEGNQGLANISRGRRGKLVDGGAEEREKAVAEQSSRDPPPPRRGGGELTEQRLEAEEGGEAGETLKSRGAVPLSLPKGVSRRRGERRREGTRRTGQQQVPELRIPAIPHGQQRGAEAGSRTRREAALGLGSRLGPPVLQRAEEGKGLTRHPRQEHGPPRSVPTLRSQPGRSQTRKQRQGGEGAVDVLQRRAREGRRRQRR